MSVPMKKRKDLAEAAKEESLLMDGFIRILMLKRYHVSKQFKFCRIYVFVV